MHEENKLNLVGKSVLRKDGEDKARGRALYTADVMLPGMLFGRILRSPHPHAKILGIDATKALALKGVKGVITAKDSIGVKHGFVETPRYPPDQEVLARDRVVYVGEEVAAVAATSLEAAAKALELIEVQYEPLPAVFDAEKAMHPDSVRIHPNNHRVDEPFANIAGKTETQWGDIEKGFAEADLVRTDRFESHLRTHGYLEPHVTVASYDGSAKMNVWTSSMGPFVKRTKLARTLGLGFSQVRIHKTYVGGTFGGKIDLFTHEYAACRLSMLTGKPVKFMISREEIFSAYRHGQPLIVEVKTGVKKDGTLVAQQYKVINNCGGYRGSGVVVIFLSWGFAMIPYKLPNLKYEGYAIYTNNPIRAPQRGHGAPQLRYAVESQLDMIAEELGLDPVEIRLKNAREPWEELPNRDNVHQCGLKDCILRAAEKTDFLKKLKSLPKDSKGPIRRGIGIGVSSYFGGSLIYPNSSSVIVKLNDDGTAILLTGAIEIGQGSETVMTQIVGEELGLSMDDIKIIAADTDTTPQDIGAWISGMTYVTGNAAREAAGAVREKLLELASRQLDEPVENLWIKNKTVFVKSEPERWLAYKDLFSASVATRQGDPIVGEGHWRTMRDEPTHPSLATTKGRWSENYAFSSQVAEVEVDIETGEIKLVRALTVHDCGFPVNPLLVKGQIDGQVSMALGHAFMEEIMMKEGRTLNPSWLDYRMPTAHNVALSNDLDVITEKYVVGKPFRTKEVGEGLVSAILAAIANAVYHATGVRFHSTPFTAEKLLKELRLQKARAKNRSNPN